MACMRALQPSASCGLVGTGAQVDYTGDRECSAQLFTLFPIKGEGVFEQRAEDHYYSGRKKPLPSLGNGFLAFDLCKGLRTSVTAAPLGTKFLIRADFQLDTTVQGAIRFGVIGDCRAAGTITDRCHLGAGNSLC